MNMTSRDQLCKTFEKLKIPISNSRSPWAQINPLKMWYFLFVYNCFFKVIMPSRTFLDTLHITNDWDSLIYSCHCLAPLNLQENIFYSFRCFEWNVLTLKDDMFVTSDEAGEWMARGTSGCGQHLQGLLPRADPRGAGRLRRSGTCQHNPQRWQTRLNTINSCAKIRHSKSAKYAFAAVRCEAEAIGLSTRNNYFTPLKSVLA